MFVIKRQRRRGNERAVRLCEVFSANESIAPLQTFLQIRPDFLINIRVYEKRKQLKLIVGFLSVMEKVKIHPHVQKQLMNELETIKKFTGNQPRRR